MVRIESVVADDVRVIMCIAFDHRAAQTEIESFKQCLIACPNVLHSVELAGTFDFMIEAVLPDLASYQEKLAGLAVQMAKLTARYEANFVCRRFIRHDHADRFIWVPCHGGMQRIDCDLIDKVVADGDYMHIHVGRSEWLLHVTLHDLLERLDRRRFLQLHRSVVVRSDFIDRLLHQGARWIARLSDGSLQRVARSHVAEVLSGVRIDQPRQAGDPRTKPIH